MCINDVLLRIVKFPLFSAVCGNRGVAVLEQIERSSQSQSKLYIKQNINSIFTKQKKTIHRHMSNLSSSAEKATDGLVALQS